MSLEELLIRFDEHIEDSIRLTTNRFENEFLLDLNCNRDEDIEDLIQSNQMLIKNYLLNRDIRMMKMI